MTLPTRRLFRLFLTPLLLPGMAFLAACSPTLDWREVHPAGSAATWLMPCKPTLQTRSVPLVAKVVQMSLWRCDAGGQTWAVAYADMADPALVNLALEALRSAAAANLGGVEDPVRALQVPGATPYAASLRVVARGQLPDGRSVPSQAAYFARGTVAFQATVLGGAVATEGAEVFFASLRFTP